MFLSILQSVLRMIVPLEIAVCSLKIDKMIPRCLKQLLSDDTMGSRLLVYLEQASEMVNKNTFW